MSVKLFLRLKNILPLVLILVFSFSALPVSAETPDELKKAIDEKAQALEEVNQKINQTQKDLEETQGKSKTLQTEVKKADYSISQVNLSIKSSELNIQKLGLEIQSLKYDINDTEAQINAKKSAISELLRELQQKDSETILALLLKNKSLADGVNEAQSLVDINSGLSEEVNALQSLNDQLSDKMTATSAAKSKKELENKNLNAKKNILQNQKTDKQNLLSQTKNQEKLYQQQLAQLQKQQEDLSKAIDDAEAKLRESFNINLLPVKRSGVLAYPVAMKSAGGVAVISQKYGNTPYSSQLYKNGFHNGLDLAVPLGTPVFAASDGKVANVDNNDVSSWLRYQYGQYVLIEHSNNLETIYGHLSSAVVKKGDVVKRGDLIGYSGNSGYSFGPHLHFGVYWAPSVILKKFTPARGLVPVGVTVNPEDYL